jgi:F0F1-type ATP synthase membrane subunit b/b'
VDVNQSLIDRLGLNDWRIAVPLGTLIAIPAIAHDVITIGAEAQLAAMFVLFIGTCHKSLGPVAGKFFSDYSASIAKDLKKVDENMLIEVNSDIESHKQLLGLDQDLSDVMALRDDLAIVQADVLNHQEKHKFRDEIQRKLDQLIAIEESATTAIRKRMISSVQANVVKQFSTDAKAKDAALAHAMSILTAGVGAKRGKDVVGDAFTRAIADYRTDYKKTKPADDAIIVQFEKDVAAVAKAPVIASVASNVYETHPLQSKAK